MCSICSSDDSTKKGYSQKGEEIQLCETCCVCEECYEDVEEILVENWKLKVYCIRPAGWIFLTSSSFERFEDYCLLCDSCKEYFCDMCKSMVCKKRCETCDSPCSENCGH